MAGRALRWLAFLGLPALGACGNGATSAAESETDTASAADADATADALPDDATATTSNSPVHFTWHVDTGTFDVARADRVLFRHATAAVTYRDGAGSHVLTLRGPCTRTQPSPDTLACAVDGLELRLQLAAPNDATHLEAVLHVSNQRADTVVIDKLVPLEMRTDAGASLELGSDPRDVRILENGRAIVLDTAVQLVHGDTSRTVIADLLPLDIQGNSISNWNHIVADPAQPEHSLTAGWLSFDRCIPTLGIGMDETVQPGAAGIRPFTVYAAENRLVFDGKPLAPGASLDSERLWLEPFPADPLQSIEQYARDVATYNHVTPWSQRGPGHPIPAGWNSWTGGGGTGGHGQDIDEALILQSLAIYKENFGSFGTNFFQVDDGWQLKHGDWQWRADRFPHGGKWLAEQIAAAGFRPGLWFAPMLLDPDSQTAVAHPDWLQPKIPIAPDFLAKDKQTPDTSNPQVHAWLQALGATLRGEGWQWLKVDFSYWAILGEHLHDPSLTHIEAWNAAWHALRQGMEALGDVYVCGIGVLGANIGRVEAMRLTADNGPQWDTGNPDDEFGVERAFLPTVRASARRWFYQNRIFQNHADLLFFRTWPEAGKQPLTFGEGRALASYIGIVSSIVKIGDKLTEMAAHPEWIDVVRRLTPVWPDGARPVDVLLRDQPEVYVQAIHAPAGDWQNVALCNWGRNRDHTTPVPTDMPDHVTRTYTVRCPDDKPCAAYEFWSETYLGEQSAPFQVQVQPHDCQILALRPLQDHPQLIGDSRHITQGAADLGPLVWDEAGQSLSTSLQVAVGSAQAPWAYHLAYRVPPPWDCPSAAIDGLDVPLVVQHDGVADLVFAFPQDMAGKSAHVRLLCQKK